MHVCTYKKIVISYAIHESIDECKMRCLSKMSLLSLNKYSGNGIIILILQFGLIVRGFARSFNVCTQTYPSNMQQQDQTVQVVYTRYSRANIHFLRSFELTRLSWRSEENKVFGRDFNRNRPRDFARSDSKTRLRNPLKMACYDLQISWRRSTSCISIELGEPISAQLVFARSKILVLVS